MMTREERVESLIHYLKHEREGYETVPEPVGYEGLQPTSFSQTND